MVCPNVSLVETLIRATPYSAQPERTKPSASAVDCQRDRRHTGAMTTPRAILLSGILIAAAVAASAWFGIERIAQASRYQLAVTGSGEAVRLDKLTGEMTSCRGGTCIALKAIPAPPSGYVIDR